MVIDGYTEFAVKIVEQAVRDWHKAYRICEKNKNNFIMQQHLFEIEDFFRSEWFQVLTDYTIRGEEVLALLREKEENRRSVKK